MRSNGKVWLKLRKIRNVDFGIPAVNYGGRWMVVTPGFLDSIWPRIKDQLRSPLRPNKDDDEQHEEPNEG